MKNDALRVYHRANGVSTRRCAGSSVTLELHVQNIAVANSSPTTSQQAQAAGAAAPVRDRHFRRSSPSCAYSAPPHREPATPDIISATATATVVHCEQTNLLERRHRVEDVGVALRLRPPLPAIPASLLGRRAELKTGEPRAKARASPRCSQECPTRRGNGTGRQARRADVRAVLRHPQITNVLKRSPRTVSNH